jgi:hypothetical protein
MVMTKSPALMMAKPSALMLAKSSAEPGTEPAAKSCAKPGAKSAETDTEPRRICHILTHRILGRRLILALLIPRRHLAGLKLGNAQLLEFIFEFAHCYNLRFFCVISVTGVKSSFNGIG